MFLVKSTSACSRSMRRCFAYSLRMYNNVVERCFRDCVDSFRRKDLDNSEERVRKAAKCPACKRYCNIGSQAIHSSCSLIVCVPLQCVTRCCEKFMKHSARVGMRFGELSSQAEQQMQQVMQQQSGR